MTGRATTLMPAKSNGFNSDLGQSTRAASFRGDGSAGRALIDTRLAACANVVDGACSVYRWEGGIQESAETVLIAKTSEQKLPHAIGEIKRLHTYEPPYITAWPLREGFPPFMQWVEAETRQEFSITK